MLRPHINRQWLLSLVTISVLALLGWTETAYGQEAETSLEEYSALIDVTQSTLDQLAQSGLETRRTGLQQLAEQWSAITIVVTPTGERVAVDHSPLVSAMQAPSADIGAVTTQIAVLGALLERVAEAGVDDLSVAQAVAQLADILSRPEFQWQEPRPTFWQQLWERLARQFFNMLPDQVGDGRLFTILSASAGLLLLLLLLYYAMRTVRRDFTSAAESENDLDMAGAVHADQALTHAQSLSEQGDYRQAIRYLYLSTLLLLDERGLIRYDGTRTNLEYLGNVAHLPQVATIFREIVEIFDRAWYGLQVPDAQTYARFESRINDLRKIR